MDICSRSFRLLFFSASTLLTIDGVSSPASSSIANVSRTSAVFEGTKGLLLAELQERESEVRLLRRALLDLGDHSGENSSEGDHSGARAAAPSSLEDEVVVGAPSEQVADALLEESDDERASPPRGSQQQSHSSKATLGSRLFRQPDTHHRAEPHESQDTNHRAEDHESQDAHHRPGPHESQDLPHNMSLQQMVARRVISTERRLVDLSETWSLAAEAATAASSAAAKEASAEAKTARAAARAQKGLTNRLTHMSANKSMDAKGKVQVLLEATAEVARLRETEVAKAERLAVELKTARDHEAMLSNGLRKTLDQETDMLEQIQNAVNA